MCIFIVYFVGKNIWGITISDWCTGGAKLSSETCVACGRFIDEFCLLFSSKEPNKDCYVVTIHRRDVMMDDTNGC